MRRVCKTSTPISHLWAPSFETFAPACLIVGGSTPLPMLAANCMTQRLAAVKAERSTSVDPHLMMASESAFLTLARRPKSKWQTF